MKLLFVTPYLPGPPVFGGQRRIHGLMTQLAAWHELSVVSLTYGAEDQTDAELDARRYCRHVISVPQTLHRIQGTPKRLVQMRSLLSLRSCERLIYTRDAVQRALDAHLREHEYDAIVCEFAFMANYRFRISRARTRLVLDEHNIEYDLLRRTAEATRLERRLFHALNWRKLKHEEVQIWKKFDGCALTSNRDEAVLKAEVSDLPTAVVPNGVDIDVFKPRSEPVQPMTLLFFGAINYYPNADAALWFAEQVMPLLIARYPNVRLRIVGPVAKGAVQGLESEHVRVVGFVDDVQAEIARAAVVVAPLRIGGGTRLKILEAMGMGKAIVATQIGAEGIDVRHDHDILLADSAADQAREIGRVLDDEALRVRLGRSARETVVARYNWQVAARLLDELLRKIVSRPPRLRGLWHANHG